MTSEWDELLDGLPTNSWDEQTYLLMLLANSTLSEQDKEPYENEIIRGQLTPEAMHEMIGYLKINAIHFSNLPNPNQTQVARFIKLISSNEQ